MSIRFILTPITLLPFLSLLLPSPVHASLTLSPAFQELKTASDSATIKFTNNGESPTTLEFSLSKIIATDLLGRFQFNAPLPQTTYPAASDIAKIDPPNTELKPNDSIDVQIAFDPNKLNPGTNGFLLLARNNSEKINSEGTTINSYIAATILVNALGGNTIDLELVSSDISKVPISIILPDFITMTVKNQGNTHTAPRGLVRVTDSFGRELMRGPVNDNFATVLPGSQRVIYSHLKPSHSSFPLALCTLHLVGYDENHQNNFTLTHRFLYINPWMLLLIPFIFVTNFIFKKGKSFRHR